MLVSARNVGKYKSLELGGLYTSFVAYSHDRLTFSGTRESFQMRIDAAKQTTPIGPRVRMLSSNKRVKSNPCRQEGATIGPKVSSSTEQSNMFGRCPERWMRRWGLMWRWWERNIERAGDRWCLKYGAGFFWLTLAIPRLFGLRHISFFSNRLSFPNCTCVGLIMTIHRT